MTTACNYCAHKELCKYCSDYEALLSAIVEAANSTTCTDGVQSALECHVTCTKYKKAAQEDAPRYPRKRTYDVREVVVETEEEANKLLDELRLFGPYTTVTVHDFYMCAGEASDFLATTYGWTKDYIKRAYVTMRLDGTCAIKMPQPMFIKEKIKMPMDQNNLHPTGPGGNDE